MQKGESNLYKWSKKYAVKAGSAQRYLQVCFSYFPPCPYLSVSSTWTSVIFLPVGKNWSCSSSLDCHDYWQFCAQEQDWVSQDWLCNNFVWTNSFPRQRVRRFPLQSLEFVWRLYSFRHPWQVFGREQFFPSSLLSSEHGFSFGSYSEFSSRTRSWFRWSALCSVISSTA